MNTQLAKDRIFMMIKFKDNLDHLKSIQQGRLYMNNGNFFKELEEKTGIPGVGDKYEMAQKLNDVIIKFEDPVTMETITISDATSVTFRLNAHMKMPMFCLTQIDYTSLRIVKEEDEWVDCALDFGSEEIDDIIKDFGEYALIINPYKFQERISKAAMKLNIPVLQKSVIYEDFNVPSKDRLMAQRNNDPNYFFIKHSEFAYQREYRVVLPSIQSETPYVLDIGDISDISHIMEARQLFNATLKLHD